jgi:hypothetical protein
MCILKMDHHCPWIYNCVGFGNHKYFFLLLLYSTIATNMITWTMLETVKDSVDNPKTAFARMFALLFGETLAAFLGLLVTVFFLFHIWLMLKAMSTIEFCEKSMKRTGYDTAYDRGLCGNIRAVLGDNFLLWLCPCSPPSGDGLSYTTEQTPLRLSKDMEASRGIRNKIQQKADKGLKKMRCNRRNHAGTGECAMSEASAQESEYSAGFSSDKEEILFEKP